MGALKRVASKSFSSEPCLVAAHITFASYKYDGALTELGEEFGVPFETIEVLEVSPFERVFALWVSKGETADKFEWQQRVMTLIGRVNALPAVRNCIIQQDSLYFTNSAGRLLKPSSPSELGKDLHQRMLKHAPESARWEHDMLNTCSRHWIASGAKVENESFDSSCFPAIRQLQCKSTGAAEIV